MIINCLMFELDQESRFRESLAGKEIKFHGCVPGKNECNLIIKNLLFLFFIFYFIVFFAFDFLENQSDGDKFKCKMKSSEFCFLFPTLFETFPPKPQVTLEEKGLSLKIKIPVQIMIKRGEGGSGEREKNFGKLLILLTQMKQKTKRKSGERAEKKKKEKEGKKRGKRTANV